MNSQNSIRPALFVTAILIAISLFVFACGPSRDKQEAKGEPQPNTTQTSKSEYRLLAVLPLSGNLAAIGTPKREAMELAIQQAKVAYPSVKMSVDFQDSQGTAKDAISVINQALGTKRPDFMFIDLTPIVDATVPIVDVNHILTFAGSAQAGLTRRSEYLFRVFPGGDQEVQLIVKYLKERQPKGVYVLHANELYGRSVNEALSTYHDEIHLLGSEEYALSEKDFRVQLTKAKESGAEAIVLLGYGSEYATMLRQAKELGIPSDHFVANLGGVNLGVVQLPPDMTEGMVFAGPAFALRSENAASYPPQQRLVEAYQKRYGHPPDFRVAFVYDTMMLLFQAIQNSKNLDEVRNQLCKINGYEGASGRISISDTRDAVVELVLGKYESGKLVKLTIN